MQKYTQNTQVPCVFSKMITVGVDAVFKTTVEYPVQDK